LQQETIPNIPSAGTAGKGTNIFAYLNRLIPVLIGIFVFFNSYPHTTAIKEITLYLALLFVIVLAVANKTEFTFKTPLTIPFLLFLAWSVVGIFFTLNRPNTIHDIYAHNIKYLVFFFMLVNFFCTEQRCRKLVWIVALSAALFSIGGTIFFYGVEGHPFSDRFGFKEMSINYLGFVTVPGLILMLGLIASGQGWPVRTFWLLAFSWTVLSTLLTQTRGAMIGLVASVLIAAWGRWKVFLLAGFFLLGFLVYSPGRFQNNVFAPTELFTDHRVSINRLTLEIIRDYPIVGVGFGMQIYNDREMLLKYNERVPEKYRQPPEHLSETPHNTYLDVAMRVGWVGFGLFIYIIAVFFKMAWQTSARGNSEFTRAGGFSLAACMVSYLIQAFFVDATFGPQAIMFYVILAIMTIVWTLNEKGAGHRVLPAPGHDYDSLEGNPPKQNGRRRV
jgi:O-antigen ligase